MPSRNFQVPIYAARVTAQQQPGPAWALAVWLGAIANKETLQFQVQLSDAELLAWLGVDYRTARRWFDSLVALGFVTDVHNHGRGVNGRLGAMYGVIEQQVLSEAVQMFVQVFHHKPRKEVWGELEKLAPNGDKGKLELLRRTLRAHQQRRGNAHDMKAIRELHGRFVLQAMQGAPSPEGRGSRNNPTPSPSPMGRGARRRKVQEWNGDAGRDG